MKNICMYGIMSKYESNISLRLCTIDCDTSTKYYQLTHHHISDEKRELIKPYFKYYTPEKFKNKNNVAGNLEGWMCQDCDLQKIEKILEINETKSKCIKHLEEIQDEISTPQTFMEALLELNI